MSKLLAVDLGIKTGLALFNRPVSEQDIGLKWYRSHNLGSSERLRRAVYSLLNSQPGVELLVLEGGGPLADIWQREAARREIRVLVTSAETWRYKLLLPRQQRSGASAKQNAEALARRVIEFSDAPNPTSLKHDAAEAILIGIWGMLEAGWLTELPADLK